MSKYKIELNNLPLILLGGHFYCTVQSLHTKQYIQFLVKETSKGNYDVAHVNFDFPEKIGTLANMQFLPLVGRGEITKAKKVFSWIWKNVIHHEYLTENINVYHHGICCKCGRKLTTPESLESGIGPECRKLLGL